MAKKPQMTEEEKQILRRVSETQDKFLYRPAIKMPKRQPRWMNEGV